MSIFCLHDYNLFTNLPYYIPNLEMMKIYEYYINYRDLVIISGKVQPEYYTKTYIFKDIDDYKPYPYILLDKTQSYGKSFVTKYKPFNEEIENIQPSFQPLIKNKDLNYKNEYKKYFSTMCHAVHNRISLDGTNIREYNLNKILDSLYNKKTVIFHDYDLGQIKNIKEINKEILSINNKYPIVVGNKFPIQCNNEQDFIDWITFGPSKKYGSVQYNGILSNDCIQEICGKKGALCSNIIYNINRKQSLDDFIKTDLMIIYKQILLLRSYKIKVLLIYDGFDLPKVLKNFIELLNIFIISGINNNTIFHEQSTLAYFVQWVKVHQNNILVNILNRVTEKVLTISDIKEIFEFLQKNNYSLFKMFYEYGDVIYKGGEIIPNDRK